MFAYVTPTVSVTLSDFGCSWEPLPNPQVNVSNPFLLFFLVLFFFSGTNELGEQNQTSCLVYLEERDKCGYRLFQGTHINYASEGVLGVGRRGGRLSARSAQLSLTWKTVKMSPSHPRQLGRAPALC